MYDWYCQAGMVAVEPFPVKEESKARVVGGILQKTSNTGTTCLKIHTFSVEDFGKYGGLTHAYLPADYNISTIFGRVNYEIDERKFTLVRLQDVLAFSTEDD